MHLNTCPVSVPEPQSTRSSSDQSMIYVTSVSEANEEVLKGDKVAYFGSILVNRHKDILQARTKAKEKSIKAEKPT